VIIIIEMMGVKVEYEAATGGAERFQFALRGSCSAGTRPRGPGLGGLAP